MIFRSIAPVLATALGASAAFAQQGSKDTTTLTPVVVTATRSDVRPVAPLVSTTVITGDALRAQGITSVKDALAQAPGVFAPQSGSYGAQTSLFMRGGDGDYTQVLVDGVPVNDPGGFIDLSNLTTDNVDRIEIVRGPASVLYGSNAVTGVVQIFTRDGREGGSHLSLSGDGGTYGASNANASWFGGGATLGGSLGIGRHRSDGIYAFNNASRNDVYSGALHVAPDAATTLRLALRYGDAGAHIPTNSYGLVQDSNQFHLERRFSASLDADRRLTERLTARVLLGATDERTESADLPDTPGEACDFCYNARAGVYRRSVDGRLDYSVTPGLTVTGGAAYESQRGHESGADAIGRTLRAYYAQALGNVGSAFSYTAGVRVDDNSQYGTFTTFRLAAGYDFAEGTSVHASVGNAFKEPTFDESSSNAPFSIGNPALRPERARSWEGGIVQDIAHGAAALSVTYFAQRFRDLIQYDGTPPDSGSPNYFNLAAATANGVEVGVHTAPLGGLSLTASYTRLQTRVTDAGVDAGTGATFVDGDRLLRRPTDLASATLAYRASTRGSLFLTTNYVGNRVDIDFLNFVRVEAPSYTTADISGSLTVVEGHGTRPSLTLTGRVANVFDVHYAPIFGFQAPGTAVLIGAKLAW
ncbi:MAG TPA: TonB-dependent receptor [Gemmatimonadaceae bacterium]|jgi:vitamin B12 transporter